MIDQPSTATIGDLVQDVDELWAPSRCCGVVVYVDDQTCPSQIVVYFGENLLALYYEDELEVL